MELPLDFPRDLDPEERERVIRKIRQFLDLRAESLRLPNDAIRSDTTESSESSETSETTESSEDSENSENTENDEFGLRQRELELINIMRNIEPSYDEWPALLAVHEVLRSQK
ncbi:hypothetical protein [Streptomyces sp. NPDC051554]|uniref:hypothetical protein n=1 Tax=Streptomyces sp. NPDC051554 TaxID=3365656 RepID=UPI0037990500